MCESPFFRYKSDIPIQGRFSIFFWVESVNKSFLWLEKGGKTLEISKGLGREESGDVVCSLFVRSVFAHRLVGLKGGFGVKMRNFGGGLGMGKLLITIEISRVLEKDEE